MPFHKKVLHTLFTKKITIAKWQLNLFSFILISFGLTLGLVWTSMEVYNLLASDDNAAWDFATPGDYSLSDSNKIEVAGGSAQLLQDDMPETDDNQTDFDGGTYSLNSIFSSGNLSMGSTPVHVSTSESNMISQWRMDNDWTDSKGSNDCTTIDDPTFLTTSKVGSHTGNFNITDAVVTDSTDLDEADAFTYSAWVYPTNLNLPNKTIFLLDEDTADGFGSYIEMGGNGYIYFTVGISAAFGGGSDTTMTVRSGAGSRLNQWNHIAVTWSPTNGDISDFAIYANGTKQSLSEIENTNYSTATRLQSVKIYHGADGRGAGDAVVDGWRGRIDEVSIYDRVLSESEIKHHYYRGMGQYGEYVSEIIDKSSIGSLSWTKLGWTPTFPFGKNLPDNGQSETAYNNGNADMSDIEILLHMDETGAPVVDYSGNSHSLSTNSNLSYGEDGVLGSSFGFTTASPSPICSSTTMSASNGFTVVGWFNPVDTTSNKYIFKLSGGTWFRDINVPGVYVVTDEGGKLLGDAATLYPNRWYHLGVVFDSDNSKVLFYRNGQLNKEEGHTGNALPITDQTFCVGASTSGGSYPYGGYMDEFAVWSRVLGADEIEDIFNRGKNRLEYQVRSCNDDACSGESFIGPDGTADTYYSDFQNSSAGQPEISLTNVSDNAYFQYKTYFTSKNGDKTPKTDSVTAEYSGYYDDKPYLNPVAATDLGTVPASLDELCEGTMDVSYNCTANVTKPGGTEVYYQLCNDTVSNCNNNDTWKYWDGGTWANASNTTSHFNTASEVNTNLSNFTIYKQYLAVRPFLSSTGLNTPVLEDLTFSVSNDPDPPDVNASNVALQGMAAHDEWTNTEPTVTWDAGQDAAGGSGLLGYCIALDEADIGSSDSLDPATQGGKLTGLDDGVVYDFCPYIVTGTSVDLNAISGLDLTTGKQYYFSIKAVDYTGNTYVWTPTGGDWQDLVDFIYDDTNPDNPAYISLPGNFVSSKDVTFTWPTSGGDAPSDDDSGLAGIQYRIGSGGTWYGDLHLGTEDENDLLTNDGSYTMHPDYDYDALQEGSNTIYIRTWDNAGNVTTSYTTGILKINTSAPSQVQNLDVDPDTNTTNSYAFSWDPPDTYTGEEGNITYCYTVNTLPSSTTCSFTAAGQTSLSADAYATQPSTNTMYVVAKDEASNINYDTYSTVQFTYTGDAPGVPQNMDIADISIKASSSWKLALTWSEPNDVGAGVESYLVYRTTTNTTCSANFGAFSEVGSTSGLSYVDTGLSQQTYYYCTKACDSANNCSAVSSTVSMYPDGKYTEPPNLVSGPSVTNKTTRRAVIAWATDREADTKVAYGTASGEYLKDEAYRSSEVTSHSIILNNLKPDTTYYYVAKWTDEDGNTGVSEEKVFKTDPPPIIKNISVKNISLSSAVIRFTSKGASEVNIYYGKTTDFGGVKNVATSTQESSYSVELSKLDDGTKYYFKINPFDIEGEEYEEATVLNFKTLPRPRISNVAIEEIKGTPQPTLKITWESNTEISSIINYFPVDKPNADADQVDLKRVKGAHEMEITGLLPETKYGLQVKGRDKIGNEAKSDVMFFTTDIDNRPPAISNVQVEGMIVQGDGVNEEAKAQLIVSWDTDELSTSQAEVGEGSGGDYTQVTQEDSNQAVNHLVIISNLTPSKVYHLRVKSRDAAGNVGESEDQVTITPKATESPFELVLKALGDIFSFL